MHDPPDTETKTLSAPPAPYPTQTRVASRGWCNHVIHARSEPTFTTVRDFESRVVVISMLLLKAAALLRGSAALTVEGTRAWLHVIGSSLRSSDPKSLHFGGVTVAAVSGCPCLLSCLPSEVCMDIDLTEKKTRLPLAFIVFSNRTHGLSKNLGALRHFSKQDDTTEHRAYRSSPNGHCSALMRAPVYPLTHLTLLLPVALTVDRFFFYSCLLLQPRII